MNVLNKYRKAKIFCKLTRIISLRLFHCITEHVVMYTYLLVDIILRFNQTVYSVNEDDGKVQPVLVLSNPSSYDVIIQVNDDEITATSK